MPYISKQCSLSCSLCWFFRLNRDRKWCGSITCGWSSFAVSWGMFSGRGSRRRSRHFCSKGKCRVALEPPPCSYDTGQCRMDLKRGTKARETKKDGANFTLSNIITTLFCFRVNSRLVTACLGLSVGANSHRLLVTLNLYHKLRSHVRNKVKIKEVSRDWKYMSFVILIKNE